MKIRFIFFLLASALLLQGCSDSGDGGPGDGGEPGGEPSTPGEVVPYASLYDNFSDKGQYTMPVLTKYPTKFWNLSDVQGISNRNSIELQGKTTGLQYHLLAQSIQGLAHLAVEEGTGSVGVWFKDHGDNEAYTLSKNALISMGVIEIGTKSAIDLALNDYENGTNVRDAWKGSDGKYGYVLTDIVNNPESGNVAAIASHVYKAIIVDVRDEALFESNGYVRRYNAKNKTMADAWSEFKEKCNNDALVLMPVQTGELRSYAITHKLFCINLSKQYMNARVDNIITYNNILAWLKPQSPVLGWEHNLYEYEFVRPAGKYACPTIPADWAYNLDLTSLKAKDRQVSRIKNTNPKTFVFDNTKSYASFFLSDGDNLQWMLGDFVPHWYYNDVANNIKTKMSFGIAVYPLAMAAPQQLDNIIAKQCTESTLMETFGGGYHYADEYAMSKNRVVNLEEIAKHTANHMRQRNCKILQLIPWECTNSNAMSVYKAFIEANDQLEGILVIQQSVNYAAGGGKIYWVKNKKGYFIPIITTRHSIVNGGSNKDGEGSPAYVASLLNIRPAGEFSAVCVNAWSNFRDIGDSNDINAELVYGPIRGTASAQQCAKRLGSNVKVVNVQELMWQARMKYDPEGTKKHLDSLE